MKTQRSNLSTFYICIILVCIVHSALAMDSLAQSSALRVLVGNQGNFSDANGSLTFFESGSVSASQDIVPGLNTLIQSVSLHEGNGYILSNTADRIDIFDLDTFERTGQITGVSSPRYMAVVNDEKAYVTNLFSATVTVINLETSTVIGTVATGTNPEDLAVIGDKVYVANFGFGTEDSTLTVIDSMTDSVIETRQTGCDGPRFLEADNENELWVFCTGKTVFNSDFTEIIEQTNGQLVIFDGETGEEKNRIPLDAQAGTSALGQDAWHDPVTQRMFFVKGAEILVFDTALNEQETSISIDGDEQIGAVAYDPGSDRLYIARITDFTSSGFVSIHDMTGLETGRFTAGIGPAFIAFYPTESSVATEDEEIARQRDFVLDAAYPNPAQDRVTIPVKIVRSGHVRLEVFNAIGQEVTVLMEGTFPSGEYALQWEATGLPRGVYFYRLSTAQSTTTKQFTLVR